MSALILEKKKSLSESLKGEVNALMAVCREGGDTGVFYPVDDEDCMHYLLYDCDGGGRDLEGVLGILPLSDDSAECIAYVRPDARRRGYFLQELLPAASEDFGDMEFIFPVRGMDDVVLAVLNYIGAEYERTEYMMELDLSISPYDGSLHDTYYYDTKGADLEKADIKSFAPSDLYSDTTFPEDLTINYVYPPYTGSGDNAAAWNTAIARCRVQRISHDSVCMYGVEVRPEERNKGFGTAMILSLSSDLKTHGIRRIIIHVSSGNIPAVSLYEKTGFRTTETLSYYVF